MRPIHIVVATLFGVLILTQTLSVIRIHSLNEDMFALTGLLGRTIDLVEKLSRQKTEEKPDPVVERSRDGRA